MINMGYDFITAIIGSVNCYLKICSTLVWFCHSRVNI